MPEQSPLNIDREGNATSAERDRERAEYLERLREYLKDPEFRAIEGFPIGEDEDILALSDPPYYTACPNPFLPEIITRWQREREEIRRGLGLPVGEDEEYHREPYATDVSEGKTDPLYRAHSYHTKVPHKAIMCYIEHYTDPGDIVLDGFCGTGMTGVAAQLAVGKCTPSGVNHLRPDATDGTVRQPRRRFTLLSDLSPTATFVAACYQRLDDVQGFVPEALARVQQVEESLSWLFDYEGWRVDRAVWSDVFGCPQCSGEIVYWEAAAHSSEVQRTFHCPHCGAVVGKSATSAEDAARLDRVYSTVYDPLLGESVTLPKLQLVEQTVSRKGVTRKVAMNGQPAKLERDLSRHTWPRVPDSEFFPGRQTNKLINGSGISRVRDMYTRRALYAYASLWEQSLSTHRRTMLFRFCLTAINNYISRKQGYFGGGGGVSGTLYTPSVHLERNVFDVLRRKIQGLAGLPATRPEVSAVGAQSATDLATIPDSVVDYIFTDPPFGESLQYAELNLFTESWLSVRTRVESDCVLNYVHKKDLSFYSGTMAQAFKEYHRVLKPGRWVTIVFHNSQNSVWNAIQSSLVRAGLVVADVRVLDKAQGSFNQVTASNAVKRDLVISAYKLDRYIEGRFLSEAGSPEGAWTFVRGHLANVPTVSRTKSQLEVLAERQPYLLYDRMVAFHLTRGATVPLSAAEFYAGLHQHFVERDGMYFLPDQVVEYDRAKMEGARVQQLTLFVQDEKSAIQWLRQRLDRALGGAPQTYQDILPGFLQELHQARHEALPELREVLEENFLQDERGRWYVPDPAHAGDLEKVRLRGLLREFDEYLKAKGRLRQCRMEAVRAGFARAWQARDYQTIVRVAERLPRQALEEDPDLLMYYDNATLMVE